MSKAFQGVVQLYNTDNYAQPHSCHVQALLERWGDRADMSDAPRLNSGPGCSLGSQHTSSINLLTHPHFLFLNCIAVLPNILNPIV